MKMGDDKPFECTVSGCGMKFTNEDHLTVHKTKHQLTLTLLPNEFKNGQTPGFVDQTPTPSKFLKNFEEVTLFHDFAKNPFEEAFKKATEQQSPCNDLESTATISPSIYDTLNTPNPGFLVAVVDNKLVDNTSHHSHHQHHQNSFVHSSEHSFYLLHSPTCPGSEPTNHGTEWSSMDVEHFNHHHQHHQQQQHVETNQSTSGSNNNNVDNLVYVANGALQQGMVDLNGVPGDSGCITYILANETLVALPSITINNDPPPANDDVVANHGVLGNRVGQSPSTREDGRHLIKICPSPSTTSSSSSRQGKAPGQMASAKNGIARTTKDKLKAAIQQNVQQQQQQLLATSNNSYMPDAVNFIHQQHGISPVTSSASSSSSSSWNMSYAVSNAEAKEIEECEDVMGSLLTSKKICLVPIEEEKDDKRKKFLERNRAAAARCRQKKKVWMNSLAVKSEQLEVSNRSMQSELKQLRKEVQMLRSLLESHKECPVTLKQRALKEEMQSDHVTSSSNSSGSGVGIVITTSDEELAMCALSNMANYAAG